MKTKLLIAIAACVATITTAGAQSPRKNVQVQVDNNQLVTPIRIGPGSITAPTNSHQSEAPILFGTLGNTGLFSNTEGALGITLGGSNSVQFHANGMTLAPTTSAAMHFHIGFPDPVDGGLFFRNDGVNSVIGVNTGDLYIGMNSSRPSHATRLYGGGVSPAMTLTGATANVNGTMTGTGGWSITNTGTFQAPATVGRGFMFNFATNGYIWDNAGPFFTNSESFIVQLDNDNNSTTERFAIYQNSATAGGGTRLFEVNNAGQTLSANGTTALPGKSFFNDPNTGISTNGSDQLQFSTNGVSRAHITSTGLLVRSDEVWKVKATATNFTTTTLTDDPELQITVAAGETWVFEYHLMLWQNDASGGFNIGHNGPSASFLSGGMLVTSSFTGSWRQDAGYGTLASTGGGSFLYFVNGSGRYVFSAGGTFRITGAQMAASATPSIIRQGSWLRGRRIAP